MKILLVCASGMSTSLLVTKMQKESNENGSNDEIFACSVDQLEEFIDNCEVILIGPQIRYKAKAIGEIAAGKKKGFAVIDSVSYGMVDGKKVLEQAYALKQS
ncbi:PTS sugar transporter subunit IIB [Pelosinus fermentans]|uniref:Phosphotransferase system lactose/cellobiose-specific IIB subunit n=1 Tax=Pelosinus fermentans JBW45 TaxID=1192197 RepID=I8TYJ8_9FIRM|nr:PTS sugar transporter subunit IIB [Pelosinus fermentans]AJQ29862.1 phosphotransferase system lactose/cellobiose-specific IIB subunit [Pelosinus fermentans JBW45]